jgi:hypothetical protein
MKLVFNSYPEKYGFPFRVIGDSGRYDTMSACDFFSDNLIVCADRQSAVLYLIKFDYEADTYEILDTAEGIVGSRHVNFELFCIQSNNIYAVSYTSELFSCEISGNKFHSMKLTPINSTDAYHGVTIAGTDSLYLTNMFKNTIVNYNIKTGFKRTIPCINGVRMKDVAIIDTTYFLALSSDKGPITGVFDTTGKLIMRGNYYDSHALIVNRTTGNCLRFHTFNKQQIDGCSIYKNYAFITCTRSDGTGYLWRAKITNDYNFIEICEIPCAGFPHGISIRNDILAYTSYTDSALYIHKLDSDCNLI